MRRTATPIAAAVLLASPAVLGFFSGGYGEEARLVAGIVAWLLAGVAAFVAPRPLPGSVAGRVTLGGLAALALLTLLSVTWAPLKASAYGDAERVAVYLGVFVAAVALRLPRRAVEPALVGA